MNEGVCFCCGKVIMLEPIDNPLIISGVYNGLIFRALGNYGSTVFDPMVVGKEELLQVIICDVCVKRNAGRVTRIHSIKRNSVAKSEQFVP